MKKPNAIILFVCVLVSIILLNSARTFAYDGKTNKCGVDIVYYFDDENNLIVDGNGKLFSNAKEILSNAENIRHNEIVFKCNKSIEKTTQTYDSKIKELKLQGYYTGTDAQYNQELRELTNQISTLTVQISIIDTSTTYGRAQKAQLQKKLKTLEEQRDSLITAHSNALSIKSLEELKNKLILAEQQTIQQENEIHNENLYTILDLIIQIGCDSFTEVDHFDVVAIDEHNYSVNTILDSTCETYGKASYECLLCGENYIDLVMPKGHNVITDKAVAPTCTEKGKSEGSHCTTCGMILVPQQSIKSLGHKYNNGTVTKKATYTATGIKTYKCTVCGEVLKTETIPKLEKKTNPIKASGKTATVKYSNLKKKNQSIVQKNAFSVSGAQGKVTYAKSSGNAKITVSSAGKITVKKGLKKGTYKIKVKVKAAGNSTYKSKTVTVMVTIKIK